MNSSNTAVAKFISRYDELLEIEADGAVPSDDLPWNPTTPKQFDMQRIRIDPKYREFVAKRVGVRL